MSGLITRALWNWNVQVGQAPTVSSYPTVSGVATKTGLTPNDLQDYLQIPLAAYNTQPPTPVSSGVVQQWLRYAEDDVENDTNIRLCQTWIAAPPAKTLASANAANLSPSGYYQQLGIDYDFEEPAYDFFFPRAEDNGWMYQTLRWRPVQTVSPTTSGQIADALNYTGVKNLSFFYPLLNDFFQIPTSWMVEDQQHGFIRLVPNVNTAVLPLFALQLSFMGFTNSVPGALWLQYTAGLTPNDYNSKWSFMKQLVLARAGVIALRRMQLSMNMGALETELSSDGLQYRSKWDPKGAFAGQIAELQQESNRLTKQARARVAGPTLGML